MNVGLAKCHKSAPKLKSSWSAKRDTKVWQLTNFISYQMHGSFDQHEWFAGRLELNDAIPEWVRQDLLRRGYKLEYGARTSGPINAVMFDRVHGTMWGASSNHGEDYGIAW